MFTRYSLKNKILGICMLLAGIAALTGGIGVIALHTVADDYDHIAEISLPSSQELSEMRAQYITARVALRTFGMEGLTPELIENAHKNVMNAIQAYEDADSRYTKIDFDGDEKQIYDTLNAEWKEYKENALRILDVAKKTDMASRLEMQTFYYKTAVGNTQRFNAAMDKLNKFQLAESAAWVAKAHDAESWGITLILITAVAGFLFASFAGAMFASALSKALTKTAESLAAGADEVASAATEISSTSEALSSSATEQASAIQETAASVEEMSAMVKKNSDNAGRSVEVAKGSQNSALRGKKVVEEMITAIDDISNSNAEIMREIDNSNKKIADIVQVISEIGNKTKVINDIVFQTKLLSFNASVEAARAGEHGKGFAVVAEEVGNLAQMSGNAAKEISSMLEGSIQKVEETVTTTRTNVEVLVKNGRSKVETGTVVAKRCGEVLDELVQDVGRVTDMVGEISSASAEQATGVQEITNAMRQLDQVTQQNTSSSHQAAAASAQLATQAESMRASVEELLKAVNGDNGKRPTPKTGSSEPQAKVISLRASRGKHEEKRSQTAAGYFGDPALPSESDVRFKEV
ncbi:MAG: hypothetical protein A2X94_03600 [Bdellovibrionales bacterium GWB1_55_8]|nr:MAG: hypothetical protein A2X94_03600 [Bdellovibrionales bacterium GWB1_55_8]